MIHLAFSVLQNWMCSEGPWVPLQDCSVTTSRVLHLFISVSLGWLQLLVALFLQPAENTATSSINIWVYAYTSCLFICLLFHYWSHLTCSSLPGQATVLRACGGARGATAAPWPASGAQLTGHAWPGAGGLLTWGVADLPVGPVGMEYLERENKMTFDQAMAELFISKYPAVILMLIGADIGWGLTEDWVAQHLVFMWRLAEERVGDGARWVREAGQVRSGCQGVYC